MHTALDDPRHEAQPHVILGQDRLCRPSWLRTGVPMMSRSIVAEPNETGSWRGVYQWAADYLALTKPRVVLMVLITTFIGFDLGSPGHLHWLMLLHTLAGVTLASAGTVALNQYLERDLDARMRRTQRRPLPDGRLQPSQALTFGLAMTAAGLLYLTLAVHMLSGLLTGVSVASYLFLYTPLKRRTPFCLIIGAVPGALPPVTGWVAAAGELPLAAWTLFALVFCWQIPHSLAIALLYRDDYARADFRLLPLQDPFGWRTGWPVVSGCVALLLIGLLPTIMHVAGAFSGAASVMLGLSLLACGMRLAMSFSTCTARSLLRASLIYLPPLLTVLVVDKARC
jgi:heme o synthase